MSVNFLRDVIYNSKAIDVVSMATKAPHSLVYAQELLL